MPCTMGGLLEDNGCVLIERCSHHLCGSLRIKIGKKTEILPVSAFACKGRAVTRGIWGESALKKRGLYMKKGLTELVFILEQSYAMAGIKADIIEKFNSLIYEYRDARKETLVTTIMSGTSSVIFHDRIGLEKVKPLTAEDYITEGNSVLLDSVGLASKHISTIQKYIRSEDRPEHTVFIIAASGRNDISKTYTAERIESIIAQRKEKRGWNFEFWGVSMESLLAAHKLKNKTAEIGDDVGESDDLTEYVEDILRIFENRKN